MREEIGSKSRLGFGGTVPGLRQSNIFMDNNYYYNDLLERLSARTVDWWIIVGSNQRQLASASFREEVRQDPGNEVANTQRIISVNIDCN